VGARARERERESERESERVGGRTLSNFLYNNYVIRFR